MLSRTILLEKIFLAHLKRLALAPSSETNEWAALARGHRRLTREEYGWAKPHDDGTIQKVPCQNDAMGKVNQHNSRFTWHNVFSIMKLASPNLLHLKS